MQRAHVVDAIAQVGREVVVRARHVGPQGVAAVLGHFDRAEHRAHRRLGAPRDVGVPAVLGAHAQRVGEVVALLEPHDLRRVAGRQERMVFELAERARERQLLIGGEVLAAEEQHLPFEQRVADLVADRVGRRFGEVDAAHLGADDLAARFDLQVVVRPGGPVVGNPAHHAGADAPGQRACQSGARHRTPIRVSRAGRRSRARGRTGPVPLRALRSTTAHVTRSATGAVASTRSMRMPRCWWKSPAR